MRTLQLIWELLGILWAIAVAVLSLVLLVYAAYLGLNGEWAKATVCLAVVILNKQNNDN